jgi:hypothetical protein
MPPSVNQSGPYWIWPVFWKKKRKKGPCIAHFRLFLRRRKGPKERQPAQPSPSLSIGRKFTTPATVILQARETVLLQARQIPMAAQALPFLRWSWSACSLRAHSSTTTGPRRLFSALRRPAAAARCEAGSKVMLKGMDYSEVEVSARPTIRGFLRSLLVRRILAYGDDLGLSLFRIGCRHRGFGPARP